MVDIPSFFKKPDFYGVLLPGYLAITLYLLLFQPDILFNSTRALSFDLFSAIVFVIFGPAVWLGSPAVAPSPWNPLPLAQESRGSGRRKWLGGRESFGCPPPGPPGPASPPGLPPPKGRNLAYYGEHARIRLIASPDERSDLDLEESQYDFSISAGIALLGLAAYHVYGKGRLNYGFPLLMVIVSVIFLAGGFAELKY